VRQEPKKRPRPEPAQVAAERSLPDPVHMPSKRLRPEPQRPAYVPPLPHHLLASEQLWRAPTSAAAPSAREDANSLPANAQPRTAADTRQHADGASLDARAPHADAQRLSSRLPEGGLLPHQYSRAASAAASLLTAGRCTATALQDGYQAVPLHGVPAAGAAAQTGRQAQPAGVTPPTAMAGPSVKPGRASPSGTPQVDVVPESPEVGSEEGSPFALAKVLAPALLASADPAPSDAIPTAISFQQTRRHSLALHAAQPSAAADGALSPAPQAAGGMSAIGGAGGARAAAVAETTPPAKRVQARPGPTASRLSRGSGVHRSPPIEVTAVPSVAAALQPVTAAEDHARHPVPGAWHLHRDGGSVVARDAAAPPAAQTLPACHDAPGLVPAPSIIQSSGAQRPLPAGTEIAEAAASLTLRLSEPDERGTPVLAGAAAEQGLHLAAAPAAAGAQNIAGLHTQAPSPAARGMVLTAAGAEHTPEPAARLGLAPIAQPLSSGRRPDPEFLSQTATLTTT